MTDDAAVREDEQLGGVVDGAAVERRAGARALLVVLGHVRAPDEAVLVTRRHVRRPYDVQQQLRAGRASNTHTRNVTDTSSVTDS